MNEKYQWRIAMILCAIGAILTWNTTSNAAVITTGDAVFLSTPPSSVANGAVESDDEIIVFAEQLNIALDQDYLDDFAVTISQNTVVNSYFIHSDRIGGSTANAVTLSGSATFDGVILGVFFKGNPLSGDGLSGTDSFFGLDGTTYPGTLGNRGTNESNDSVSFSGSTIDFTMVTTTSVDQIRILTALATIPVPAALPLLSTGLAVLGLIGWRRRRAV